MARAANDMSQLSSMIDPGFDVIYDSFSSLAINIVFIGLLNWHLLLTPVLFTLSFLIALRYYARKLNPVSDSMREQFGELNAGLNEAVSGIEVVKATAQEGQEKLKFERNAGHYRDFFIQNGLVQAWYLPPLLFSIALVGAFLQSLLLVLNHQLSVGGLVSFIPGIHRELGLQPGAAGCSRRRAHPGYSEGRDRVGRERRRLQRADMG